MIGEQRSALIAGLGRQITASRIGRAAYRHRRLVPFASFAMGAASFFLVERQAQLAQWVTALMLLGWVALLFEGLLCRVLARWFGERVPQLAVRFAAQSLHQETLFFVLPSFNDVLRAQRWWRWLLLAGLSIAMAAVSWYTRFWIPPATLRATDIAISARMDVDDRRPVAVRDRYAASAIGADGLYAFTAIKAPRGMHQKVLHVWAHNGRVVDRIALQIVGGTRKQGYRAWSHKTSLGKDPTGHWRVSVVTDDGQLIGAQRFIVD